MRNERQTKIDLARECILEHLSHVGIVFNTEQEALEAARATIRKSGLDSAQICQAQPQIAETEK